MINYKELKVDDPGTNIKDALSYLKSLTVKIPLEVYLINERTIYRTLGSVDGESFLMTLEGISTDNPVIARVVKWLKPGSSESGIDITNEEVQVTLNSLVGVNGITQTQVDSLISLGSNELLKYPTLKMGDLEYTRST